MDRSLNEAVTEKNKKYQVNYNNNPPVTLSFMSPVTSTSGRLHSEFVRLLFLQDHRETDRFFVVSGVQLAQQNRGQFHYLHTVFSSILKSKCGSILAKVTGKYDGASLVSRSHTHPSHSQTSRL